MKKKSKETGERQTPILLGAQVPEPVFFCSVGEYLVVQQPSDLQSQNCMKFIFDD